MNAYNFIKNGIIQGKFKPGARLTEEKLAQDLQISRTPIREAIKQLKTEGLLVPLKRGMSVRNFTREDIRQIYDLRTLLEGYAAGQAAINRTEADLLQMADANLLYEKAIDQYIEGDFDRLIEIVEMNHKFHESIVKASRNQHINFHISKVVVIPVVYRSFYWYNHEKIKRSLDYHKILLNAIENQDADRARIAMHEHIYQGRDQVLKRLEDTNDTMEEEIN